MVSGGWQHGSWGVFISTSTQAYRVGHRRRIGPNSVAFSPPHVLKSAYLAERESVFLTAWFLPHDAEQLRVFNWNSSVPTAHLKPYDGKPSKCVPLRLEKEPV